MTYVKHIPTNILLFNQKYSFFSPYKPFPLVSYEISFFFYLTSAHIVSSNQACDTMLSSVINIKRLKVLMLQILTERFKTMNTSAITVCQEFEIDA